jgi:hypothetical protein
MTKAIVPKIDSYIGAVPKAYVHLTYLYPLRNKSVVGKMLRNILLHLQPRAPPSSPMLLLFVDADPAKASQSQREEDDTKQE